MCKMLCTGEISVFICTGFMLSGVWVRQIPMDGRTDGCVHGWESVVMVTDAYEGMRSSCQTSCCGIMRLATNAHVFSQRKPVSSFTCTPIFHHERNVLCLNVLNVAFVRWRHGIRWYYSPVFGQQGLGFSKQILGVFRHGRCTRRLHQTWHDSSSN